MKQIRNILTVLSITWICFISAISSHPFRMIDLNVWSGTDYQDTLRFNMWENPEVMEQRYQILSTYLKEARPDVIFIQEASPVDRYARRLAKDLDMDEVHQVCIAGLKVFGLGLPLGFKEGNAILAKKKYKLLKLDDWKLSGSPGIYCDNLSFHTDETVAAILGRISIDGKPVYLICTHLNARPRDDPPLADSLLAMLESGNIDSNEYNLLYDRWIKGIHLRQKEMGILLEHINELPGDVPMILGGDLNASPHSSQDIIQNFINQGQFVQLSLSPDPEAVTWDAINNTNTFYSQRKTDAKDRKKDNWYVFNAIAASLPRRLDYIFLNHVFAGTDSISNQIILDQPVNGLFASDHYGILVDLDISQSLVNVPLLYGPLEKHRFSKSIFPMPYPGDNGLGYIAELNLLSALKHNESINLYLDNTTGGNRLYRITSSVPDYKLRQRRKYSCAVDLKAEYCKRYESNFFGIGNNSSYENKVPYIRETSELTLSLNRSFSSYFVGQIGFRFNSVRMSGYPSGSMLDDYFTANPKRLTYSNLFESFRLDTRDRFDNPRQGLLLQEQIEPLVEYSSSFNTLTSRFKACPIKYTVNLQTYKVLWFPTTVLALRLQGQHIAKPGSNSDLPWQALIPLGGATTLRGSVQDRYLGSVMTVANAEIRYPIYTWIGIKIGGILAWDTGNVWSELNEISFKNWPGNPTAGLRLNLPDIDMLVHLDLSDILLRFDAGFGKEKPRFYLGFGQAF